MNKVLISGLAWSWACRLSKLYRGDCSAVTPILWDVSERDRYRNLRHKMLASSTFGVTDGVGLRFSAAPGKVCVKQGSGVQEVPCRGAVVTLALRLA